MRILFIYAMLAAQATAETAYVIGDSISLGYTPFLAEELGHQWSVQHNPGEPPYLGNARETGYGLINIKSWLPPGSHYDLIVANWALWDINGGSAGKPVTTLPVYEANIRALFADIALHADVVIIPNCTHVEVQNDGSLRNDSDAVEYGAAISRIAREFGFKTVDLYTPTSQHPEWYVDSVHMNGDGYRCLAQCINKVYPDRNLPSHTGLGIALLGVGIVCIGTWSFGAGINRYLGHSWRGIASEKT